MFFLHRFLQLTFMVASPFMIKRTDNNYFSRDFLIFYILIMILKIIPFKVEEK